jgi:uncharacterized protein (TIGR02118 family)
MKGGEQIMVKLIALYKQPSDPEEFDRHFSTVHVPLVRAVPGLHTLEITRITGAPFGEARFHLMEELVFESQRIMDTAMSSPQGKSVARDVMSFAADLVVLLQGVPGDTPPSQDNPDLPNF